MVNLNIFKVGVIISSLFFLKGCIDTSPEGGEGYIHLYGTNQPIEGVEVKIGCMKGYIHGSGEIDAFYTITDLDGRFVFKDTLFEKCTWLSPSFKKEGFVATLHFNKWDKPPTMVYMMEEDIYRFKVLKGLLNEHIVNYVPADAEYKAQIDAYLIDYRIFTRAMDYAKTAEEKNYIAESLCSRLDEEYSNLTEENKVELKKWVAYMHLAFDHEKEVVSECAEYSITSKGTNALSALDS